MSYEVETTIETNGNVQITLKNNKVFQNGEWGESPESGPQSAYSDLHGVPNQFRGEYNPTTKDLFVDWYATLTGHKQVGTELIQEAIAAVGKNDVATLSGQLAGTNRAVFSASREAGLSVANSVWATPLGQSARALGFTEVTLDSAGLIVHFGKG